MKSIEKYSVLTRLNRAQLKLVAYQSSTGAISDCIKRYLKEYPGETWECFKQEVTSCFCDIKGSQHALSFLRTIKQTPGENVQIFAERLLFCLKKLSVVSRAILR